MPDNLTCLVNRRLTARQSVVHDRLTMFSAIDNSCQDDRGAVVSECEGEVAVPGPNLQRYRAAYKAMPHCLTPPWQAASRTAGSRGLRHAIYNAAVVTVKDLIRRIEDFDVTFDVAQGELATIASQKGQNFRRAAVAIAWVAFDRVEAALREERALLAIEARAVGLQFEDLARLSGKSKQAIHNKFGSLMSEIVEGRRAPAGPTDDAEKLDALLDAVRHVLDPESPEPASDTFLRFHLGEAE